MSSPSPEFMQICEEALAIEEHLSPEAEQSIVEHLRLRFKYAGEYVAYTERWEESGPNRNLVVDVYAHDFDREKVEKAVLRCTDEVVEQIKIRFADPLDDDFEVPDDIEVR